MNEKCVCVCVCVKIACWEAVSSWPTLTFSSQWVTCTVHTTVAVLFRVANCYHVCGQRKRNKRTHELELSLIRHITRKYNQIRRVNKQTTLEKPTLSLFLFPYPTRRAVDNAILVGLVGFQRTNRLSTTMDLWNHQHFYTDYMMRGTF
jgi:hypothetical protein